MRIGIDYTSAILQGAGVGRYTRGLVDALIPLLGSEHQLSLLYPREEPSDRRINWPENVRMSKLPLPDRWQTVLWHRLRLPIPVEAFMGSVDLFHAPNFLLPPTRAVRKIVTIHDLAFVVHPQYAYPPLRQFLLASVPRSLARADHILADSQASRDDAITYLDIDPDRISVVGAGVDPRFQAMATSDCQVVLEKYDLAFPFILSISTLEPRKNFDGLIRSFAAARKQTDIPHHLVIGGGRGWMYEPIFAEVERLGLNDYVHFLGYVDDHDLPSLYNLADLFVFASHYEGFGIPVLEAMACGTPVVCTDTSSLPEIAGDAAHLVPVDDDIALADAIVDVLSHEEFRQNLATRGPKQAQKWTWHAAAERLLAIYERLARS